jgi:ectoine hydroxylase-related dioxygenase (phytanoyl-CoA dioxygenase family)
MFYYKPPGGLGQALHQDNYYLRVEPGTCIAAWTAIDPADQENGGLVVVPKTQHLDILCPHEADPSLSFFRDEVDLPEGSTIVPAVMQAGDVLFFNGSTIHGSWPNRSRDRFRRSFICHYIGVSSLQITHNLHDDLYRANGEVVTIAKNENGGPCGEAFETAPH